MDWGDSVLKRDRKLMWSLMDIKIKGFLETSFLDWPGKVSAVVFFPGCNLRCPFCHNWRLFAEPEAFLDVPLPYIFFKLESLRDWIDGVTLSGGEPTLQSGLMRFIGELKRRSFQVKLDTNGTNPQILRDLMEKGLIDFVAMDVKAPLDPFHYKKATGVNAEVEKIKESIEILKEGKIPYILRMTYVPGLHTEDDLLQLASQLKGKGRLVLQNFDPTNAYDPSLRLQKPLSEKRLKELQKLVDKLMGFTSSEDL
jgi:pyruvate formate lyase activating enzyme